MMSRVKSSQHSGVQSNGEQSHPFSKQSHSQAPATDERYERRYLSPEEVNSLFEAMKARDRQLYDMSYLSLHTGLSASEICNLKGKDVKPIEKNIYVPGRKGMQKRVPTNQDVMEKIARYVKGDRDYLFTSPKGKKLKKIPDAFVRAAEDIGLSPPSVATIDGKRQKIQRTKAEVEAYRRERVCFNTLRHTFAVWLALNGLVTLYELHEYLRNKNFEITKRYARLSQNRTTWRRSPGGLPII